MKISLVTIAFNGYGRFVGQWLAYAYALNPQPDEIIVVLGQNHDCVDLQSLKQIHPHVKFLEVRKRPSFGRLRNIGIKHTTTEWTWFVSVDDRVEPDAIKTFKRAIKDNSADYICSQWNTIGLDKPLQPHKSPLPIELARHILNGGKGGFIIPHSPFKRWIWEKHPYKDSELPNYDFLLHAVLNGAEFVKSDKPTTTYLRRDDSHARTRLLEIKKQARMEKKIMEQGVVNHYQKMI